MEEPEGQRWKSSVGTFSRHKVSCEPLYLEPVLLVYSDTTVNNIESSMTTDMWSDTVYELRQIEKKCEKKIMFPCVPSNREAAFNLSYILLLLKQREAVLAVYHLQGRGWGPGAYPSCRRVGG